MKIWIIFAIVFLSAQFAESQQPSKDTIEVKPDNGGVLVAEPPVIQLTSDSTGTITINGMPEDGVTCTLLIAGKSDSSPRCHPPKGDVTVCDLEVLPKGVKGVFEFSKNGQKACVVVLPAADTVPWSGLVLFLAASTALLSLVSLRSPKTDELGEQWKGVIEMKLNKVADAILEAAKPLGGNARNDRSSDQSAESTTADDLRAKIAGLIGLITDWYQTAGHRRSQVDAALDKLRKLEKKSSTARPSQVEADMLQCARNAAEDMVEASDHYFDQNQANRQLQRSLEETVRAAGLSLFAREGERPSQSGYRARTCPRSSANQPRGVVARVIKRGLIDEQGNVISKAEVEIYD